jgi:hypothetical protein
MPCRYMCEQVSHHPPVLAYFADSQAGWELQVSSQGCGPACLPVILGSVSAMVWQLDFHHIDRQFKLLGTNTSA